MNINECAERLRYYGEKCAQHLNRGRLSHVLALRGVCLDAPSLQSKFQNLIRASYDEIKQDLLDGKLRHGLHELHLVSLKADFELYLNRVLTVLWTAHFDRLAQNAPKRPDVSLRDIADATIQGATARDFVIEAVVPAHGLAALTDAVEQATGISVPKDLIRTDFEYSQWSQIRVAFEVRHLIEHRDGKVDCKFREHVEGFWDKSTWGKRDVEVTNLQKVTVEEEDVVSTHSAMCKASRVLTDALVEWNSKVAVKG